MKWIMIVGGIAVVTALAVGVFFITKDGEEDVIVDKTEREEVEIVLTEEGFEPRQIRISKGTTVVFSTTLDNQFWPASNIHPNHEIYSAFDPRHPINPDETWSFTFDKIGAWGVHDHIRSYFTGTIYVSE